MAPWLAPGPEQRQPAYGLGRAQFFERMLRT